MHASISFQDTRYIPTAENLLKPYALGEVITSAIGNSSPTTVAKIDNESQKAVESAVAIINEQNDQHTPTLEVRFL